MGTIKLDKRYKTLIYGIGNNVPFILWIINGMHKFSPPIGTELKTLYEKWTYLEGYITILFTLFLIILIIYLGR